MHRRSPMRLDFPPPSDAQASFVHVSNNPQVQLSARLSSSIPHTMVKPHVPVSVAGYRDASNGPFKLPKLQTKGQDEAFASLKNELSSRFMKGYQTPANLISEVRVHQMSPLPKDLNLKNLTALELHRFVGEQMKLSSRANKALLPLFRTVDDQTDEDKKQSLLRQKQF